MKQGRIQTASRSPFEEDGDVNPMDGLGNLADAMLVLAVGIMLALVMAWNVDIAMTSPENEESMGDTQVESSVSELEDANVLDDEEEISLSDGGLTEYGKVYIDENGNFYVEQTENNN